MFSSQDPNPIAVATPRIDALLAAFKKHGVSTPEEEPSGLDTSLSEAAGATGRRVRIHIYLIDPWEIWMKF